MGKNEGMQKWVKEKRGRRRKEEEKGDGMGKKGIGMWNRRGKVSVSV